MKLTKRVVALFLTVMLLLTAIPLGTFADEGDSTGAAGQPVAVACVSQDGTATTAEELCINEGFSGASNSVNEKISFVSFAKADFADKDYAHLYLPVTVNDGTSTASLNVNVYLIDNYLADVSELTYSNMPALETLVGTYNLVNGTNQLDVSSVLSMLGTEGDNFTLAFRAAEEATEIFSQNFDEITEFVSGTDYKKGGSGTLTLSLENETDSTKKVLKGSVTANNTRFRLCNSLGTPELTSDDVGKNYHISFKIESTEAIRYGLMQESASEHNCYWDPTTSTTEWTTVTQNIVITEAMAALSDDTKGPLMLTVTLKTASTDYYFDDFSVVAADTATLSNSAEDPIVCISGMTKPVADTYVSAANPDTAYGSETTLKLGDADGDKKLMVLSFASDVLKNNNYVLLNLPNSGSTLEDVSVYWIANYCLVETGENALTYNKLKALEGSVTGGLLGTYDFVSGINKLDLSSIRDNLTGYDNFTLVFRTEAEVHSFTQGFESYEATALDAATIKTPTANNATVNDVTYYYGHIATSTNKEDIARVAGGFASYQVNTSDNNNYLRVHTSASGKEAAYLKFYNSMSDSVLTEADVGKTYRFTAEVSVTNSASGQDVYACVMLSDASADILKQSASTTVKTSSGAASLTVEYTIGEEDIAQRTDSEGNSYYAYPMFSICFGDNATSAYKYHVDNLSVVEVCGDATFASSEDTAATNPVKFVSGLDGNITVMETMVSSATTGDVFKIVDGTTEKVLLSVEEVDGKKTLTYGTTTLCNSGGVAYDLNKLPANTKVVAIYNDARSRVRFVVGDALACYGAGTVTDYNNPQPFSGGVSENAFIVGVGDNVTAVTATWLKQEAPELIGFQYSLVDNTSVRFLAGIDSLYYTEIGFKVAREGYETREAPSSYVFTYVNVGGDEPVSATTFDHQYMTGLVIENIAGFESATITVTPYVKMGTTELAGTATSYTITITNGTLNIEKASSTASTASAE